MEGVSRLRKVVLTTVILFVLFCTFRSNRIVLSNDGMIDDSSISSQTYTAHSPMVINSNDDFVSEG